MFKLELPWPPSVNGYWQRSAQRTWISKRGKEFRRNVYHICQSSGCEKNIRERLFICVQAYPPDRRQRDLDNILKGLLDSLEHAHVILNDEQIDRLFVCRREVVKYGKVIVTIKKLS